MSTTCADALELASKVGLLMETVREKDNDGVPRSWLEPSASDDELGISLTVWRAAAGSLSKNATKVALVFGDGKATATEASSICSETLGQCEELETARYVAASSGAGAPLKELVDASTRQILMAMKTLATALHSKKSDGSSEAGVVWEVAEIALKLPKSNRAAYRRKFLTWSAELKDSLDEFKDMLKGDDDDEENTVNDFDDFDDADFSKYATTEDETAAKQCLGLLEAIGMTYRRSLLALDDRGKKGDFKAIADLYTIVKRLKASATAAAEELYPPLDKNDLIAKVDALDAIFADLRNAVDLKSKDRDLPALWDSRLEGTRAALRALDDDDDEERR